MSKASSKGATGSRKRVTRAPGPTAGRRRVTFRLEAEPGCQVYVAGSFNAWNPHKHRLKPDGDGGYCVTVLLPRGTYEYKFIVDEVWRVDPECPEWTPNGMGSLNSVVTIL